MRHFENFYREGECAPIIFVIFCHVKAFLLPGKKNKPSFLPCR
jgi:hypothetical protein